MNRTLRRASLRFFLSSIDTGPTAARPGGFPYTCPVSPVSKSHITLVVQHSGWEGAAAQILDTSDSIKCFARNDHLGLIIPYEYHRVDYSYEPDFLVRLTNDVTLVLEIKGYEIHDVEKLNQKRNAARRWVTAVNNLTLEKAIFLSVVNSTA